MSVMKIIDALSIPPDARVDRRVSKTLLLEQDIPTSADRRRIRMVLKNYLGSCPNHNIGVSS